MVRKVIRHNDKPKHQRWLYHLSDHSWFKALIIIWAVCILAIGLALLLVKGILAFLSHKVL